MKIKDAFQEVLGGDDLAIKAKVSRLLLIRLTLRPDLLQVLERFDGFHLAQVGRKISETVDLEKSALERRTVILPGINEELDQLKRTLDGLESFLNEVARKLSEKMPSDIRGTLNVIYFPQIGFLVTVPIDMNTGAAVYDGLLDSPWEQVFTTE